MGELKARRCTVAMAATTTHNVASPRLERLHWRVEEVEEMVAELWVRWICQRYDVDGVRARWRHAAMAMATRFSSGMRERER